MESDLSPSCNNYLHLLRVTFKPLRWNAGLVISFVNALLIMTDFIKEIEIHYKYTNIHHRDLKTRIRCPSNHYLWSRYETICKTQPKQS